MFLDAYKVLGEAANEEVDNDIEELEVGDAEEEIEQELEDVEEIEDSDEEDIPAEAIPVAKQENGRFVIEAGFLFKFMKANRIDNISEAFKTIVEANKEVDEEETDLAVDEEELKDESVEEALNLVRTLKESGINLLLVEGSDCDHKDCDGEECDHEEEEKDAEEVAEEISDGDEEIKEAVLSYVKNHISLNKELASLNSVSESELFLSEAMLPLCKKDNKVVVEYYYLHKFMKRNNIASIKEALERLVEAEEDLEKIDDLEVVIDPEEVKKADKAECAKEIKEAKEAGINLKKDMKAYNEAVALNEGKITELRLNNIDKRINVIETQIEKVKEHKKWWNSLSDEEKKKERNFARAKFFITTTVGAFMAGGIAGKTAAKAISAVNIGVAFGVGTSVINRLLNPKRIAVFGDVERGYEAQLFNLNTILKNLKEKKKKLEAEEKNK